MRWIFISCLTLLFLTAAAEAESGDCPVSDVKVTVTAALANPVYDFSTGIPEIQSMADTIVHRVRAGWALGFTRTQPLLVMDAPVAVTPVGDGRFCARPRYIHVTIGYKDQAVYIPREIPAESCGLSEVIEHEQKHLAANRQSIKKYAALAESRFSAYFRSGKNLPQDTAEQSVAVTRNMLRAALDEVVEKMIAENAVHQQDIDSADEYHRLLTVCGGQLADIVKEARYLPRVAENFVEY